jgi:hypothetical protein
MKVATDQVQKDVALSGFRELTVFKKSSAGPSARGILQRHEAFEMV